MGRLPYRYLYVRRNRLLLLSFVINLASSFPANTKIKSPSESSFSSRFCRQLKMKNNDDNDPVKRSPSGSGDDLSSRFKFKVNALMGAFDPLDQTKDNENVDGNILNAMLIFPTEYTFHVVGKTSSDTEIQDAFVAEVKSVLCSLVGEPTHFVVTPRKSFTKVSMTATVESSETIVAVYGKLASLPSSVMQF